MNISNKSRPSAGNTGTAQTKHNAPIISHDLDECKQYLTLRAQLALAGRHHRRRLPERPPPPSPRTCWRCQRAGVNLCLHPFPTRNAWSPK